jgi:hypothetical protein
MEFQPEELLRIIKGYALQGASDESLVTLLEHLSPHTPLINTKEYKDINTSILKIVAGERDRARNVTQDLKEYISTVDGAFNLNECYNAIGAVDTKEKAIVRKALCLMAKNGQLEKAGSKTGNYRRPNTDYDVIDLDGEIPDPLKVTLPLRIDQLANVYNGMTLLVEGEKSSGKSAFGLETAWLNRNLFPDKVRYMQNGELNKQMLTIRLMMRPQDLYPVKKFSERIEFITRHAEWWDIINPTGFNIVDYIEEHDKKYLIPDYISKIQARLTTGLALIILQRVPGRDYGTGGAEIRNKPSVICALKRNGGINTVHIEDIKSFNTGTISKMFDGEIFNPRGLWREYNLVDGWKFLPKGDWRTTADDKKYDYFKKGKDNDFPHED